MMVLQQEGGCEDETGGCILKNDVGCGINRWRQERGGQRVKLRCVG